MLSWSLSSMTGDPFEARADRPRDVEGRFGGVAVEFFLFGGML